METRLLALERQQALIDDELRNLDRQVVAIAQEIWDTWGEVQSPGQPTSTPPDGVTKYPAVCPLIPFVLTVVHSTYGSFPITWDGTSTWTGCKLISYAGTITCPAAASTPMFFTLNGDNSTPSWMLNCGWVSHTTAGVQCPINGAACTSTPNQIFSDTQTFQCSGTTTWGRTAGAIDRGAIPTWSISLP
jgi:hypothetical protein